MGHDGAYNYKRGWFSVECRVRRRVLCQVVIEDQDRKSTCQSVNDPHVTTFDGL